MRRITNRVSSTYSSYGFSTVTSTDPSGGAMNRKLAEARRRLRDEGTFAPPPPVEYEYSSIAEMLAEPDAFNMKPAAKEESKKEEPKKEVPTLPFKQQLTILEDRLGMGARHWSGMMKDTIREYVTLRVNDMLKDTTLTLDQVMISNNNNNLANHLNHRFEVRFGSKVAIDKEVDSYMKGFTCYLDELHGNCSSVSIHHFKTYGIRGLAGIDVEKLSIDYAILMEDLCKLARYSQIFISISNEETPLEFAKYVRKNYKFLTKFMNKRNRHAIEYYSTDIKD